MASPFILNFHSVLSPLPDKRESGMESDCDVDMIPKDRA